VTTPTDGQLSAEEVVARALWEFAMGGDTWADEDVDAEDRERCLQGARTIIAALDLPARDAAVRAAEADRLAAIDIDAIGDNPLWRIWSAALDASQSPDFRNPPGQRCETCDGPIGDLDEAAYLRYQRRVIEKADAAVRAQERAAVAEELLKKAAELRRLAADARDRRDDGDSNGERHMQRFLAQAVALEQFARARGRTDREEQG
jgi:hypothetical protein